MVMLLIHMPVRKLVCNSNVLERVRFKGTVKFPNCFIVYNLIVLYYVKLNYKKLFIFAFFRKKTIIKNILESFEKNINYYLLY